ncbi:MAG: hypothetical protein V4436_01350 [Patescibacteria group bacterium]
MQVHALSNPHTHWRELEMIKYFLLLGVAGGTRLFGFMPNTKKGLTKAPDILEYKSVADESVPEGMHVDIIPIGQITEATTEADIDAWVAAGIIDGKIYPRFRTTNSELGVRYYVNLLPIVRYAGLKGVRVHLHPENPNMIFDNRDAEFQFIEIAEMFLNATEATIIWEHGTDARCVPHWKVWAKTGRFYLTLTAHHLLGNESDTYGDVDAACKPPYKTELDRLGLIALVLENHSWVMAIDDDAPHQEENKHVIGRCACGAYTSPFLLLLFAHALDELLQTEEGRVIFNNFISNNTRTLYGIRTPIFLIELVRKPFLIPLSYTAGPWTIVPFWAGRELLYSFV